MKERGRCAVGGRGRAGSIYRPGEADADGPKSTGSMAGLGRRTISTRWRFVDDSSYRRQGVVGSCTRSGGPRCEESGQHEREEAPQEIGWPERV